MWLALLQMSLTYGRRGRGANKFVSLLKARERAKDDRLILLTILLTQGGVGS